MVELRHVSKRYGRVEALRDVSFSAPAGEIVGLLGLNGAGKTTALNILTGYMPPTEGQVLVGGVDMLRDPRACKRLIGYLPETPPLYEEMTVSAYLAFVARLREVLPAAIPAHVREIMSLCGLGEEADRVIGHLSRGYRQRVGVAQALCGNPPLLILDEPTVGLDPRQVVEMRALIRELGREHTVLFSSHTLSEVQQLCGQVIILDEGRVVQTVRMAEMNRAESLRLRASIRLRADRLLPALRRLPCVLSAESLPAAQPGLSEVRLTCRKTGAEEADPQTQLFHLLSELDAPLLHLSEERDSLEDLFLRVTAGGADQSGEANP